MAGGGAAVMAKKADKIWLMCGEPHATREGAELSALRCVDAAMQTWKQDDIDGEILTHLIEGGVICRPWIIRFFNLVCQSKGGDDKAMNQPVDVTESYLRE